MDASAYHVCGEKQMTLILPESQSEQDEILTITAAFDWADFTWLRTKRKMIPNGNGSERSTTKKKKEKKNGRIVEKGGRSLTDDFIGGAFFDSDSVAFKPLDFDNFYQSLGIFAIIIMSLIKIKNRFSFELPVRISIWKKHAVGFS